MNHSLIKILISTASLRKKMIIHQESNLKNANHWDMPLQHRSETMDDALVLGSSLGRRFHWITFCALSPFLSLFPQDVGSLGARRAVAGFNAWPGDLTWCVLVFCYDNIRDYFDFFRLRIFQMEDARLDWVFEDWFSTGGDMFFEFLEIYEGNSKVYQGAEYTI